VKKEVLPYKDWLKTQNIPKLTTKEIKEWDIKIKRKTLKELNLYKKMDVFEYNLYQKQDEVKDKLSNYDEWEIKWVKKLIWKPKDVSNYRGEFRRIYPELLFCGNEFQIQSKDIYGNDSITVFDDNEPLLRHWKILRLLVSRAPDDGTVGRQFRLIVRDKETKKYLGIICISSDMVDTPQRNDAIGIGKSLRKLNSIGLQWNNTANGQTIVPTQPFGKYFLGGKLMSLLCLSEEVCSMWKKLYGNTLVGVTTTSLYGTKNIKSSTQYDGLTPFWKSFGQSAGNTPFKFTKQLTKEIKEWSRITQSKVFYDHFPNRMREGKKRFFQKVMRDFKIPELKSVSNYKRNVYYSRLYKESDTYCQNLCKVFKSVAIKERVLSKDGSKVILHKDKITEELKRKLQIKTKQILEKEQIPDNKLTKVFDNSIKSLTEHWRFGWVGDSKKVPPELLKKYGKDVRRMVKGRVDTSEMFKEPIQLSGKGIDWYEDLGKLSWEQAKKIY